LDAQHLKTLRLGTRGSLLARTQSQLVATELEKLHPGLFVELIIMKTSGDQITERPLHEFGGKGLFTKELEQALLDEQVDFAVHSFKDVPTTMPLVEQSRLIIAAVPQREVAHETWNQVLVGWRKHLRLEQAPSLPHASSLCGACTDACPVKIPLHELLLDLRRDLVEEGVAPRFQRVAFWAWSWAWSSVLGYRLTTLLARLGQPLAGLAGPGRTWSSGRSLPRFGRRFRDRRS